MTKTLSIRDEVYEKLLRLKREGESFSDLFLRIAGEEDTLELLKRLRGTIEITDKDQLLQDIYVRRAERRYDYP